MKWLRSRERFLNEAKKLREVILPMQAKAVRDNWGERFLEFEEIEPTDKIKQGTWKLSDEDKKKVLGIFFDVNIEALYKIFNTLPDKFCEVLKQSINVDLLSTAYKDKFGSVLLKFEIKDPSLDEIYLLYENIFRKLSVGETKSVEMIKRDDTGKPIMGEDSKPVKVAKAMGDPIFTNNLVNINSFIEDYNSCYPEAKVEARSFRGGVVEQIRNSAGADFSVSNYTIDFEIFKKDLFLSINHNPKDILNISISKFYASCQHLYTGGYRSQVIGNVFDPNSIPAFLKFDTPIFWKGDKISDQLPLCRLMVRNIEGFGSTEKPRLYFDRCYPDKLHEVMSSIIIKYSENINNFKKNDGSYLFTPDLDPSVSVNVNDPYMDNLSLKRGTYIGQNTKTLYMSADSNWSLTLISPKAQIKELIIETVNVPSSLYNMSLNLDWVKFKFIKINTLSVFKFKTKSYSFEKCRFTESVLKNINESNPDISKLSLIGCEIPNISLSEFKSLEELELVYTLDEDAILSKVLEGVKINKLTISSDTLSNKENKLFISSLKRKGIKVEIQGPNI